MHKVLFLIKIMLKNGQKTHSILWAILLSLRIRIGVLLKNWNQRMNLISLTGQKLTTATLKRGYCLTSQTKQDKLTNTIIRKLLI